MPGLSLTRRSRARDEHPSQLQAEPHRHGRRLAPESVPGMVRATRRPIPLTTAQDGAQDVRAGPEARRTHAVVHPSTPGQERAQGAQERGALGRALQGGVVQAREHGRHVDANAPTPHGREQGAPDQAQDARLAAAVLDHQVRRRRRQAQDAAGRARQADRRAQGV